MIRRVIALPRAVKLAGIVGGMLYAVHFGAWVWSLTMTSVAASVTLVTATPIMLALYGLLSNRDRPGSRLGIALVLAIIGVGCIGGYDLGLSTRALVGDLLALVGALGMAIYMVVVRRLGAIDTMAFINIAAAVGALILLSTAMAIGISPLPPTSEAWLWLALAALVPQLIGHTILTWSLRHTTPTRVAMMTVGEPVGAATLAWVWLGDQLSMQVILGCAITCAAVLTAISDGRVGSESLKENSTSEK
jgi:drug/metabolite transporter (DMT)-like permease